MAAIDAAETDSLSAISDNISISFLPDHQKLADRILKRGLNFYTQSFIHDIKVYPETSNVKVVAKCWRSMRKSEKPHSLHIEIAEEKIVESYCSCKVG